ncbi:MAG: hypothetical protein ACRET7_08900 [Burkholderiales bacterium]
MHLQLATNLTGLSAYLPTFLSVAGGDRWKKRAVQLARDSIEPPFQDKIAADYHWLELALSEQMIINEVFGRLVPERLTLRHVAALHFAGMVVEVYGHLSAKGRTSLEGRIRDALKAETGFASLYLEMDIALRLLGDGFDIEFPDLEGTAQYDLRFFKGTTDGEVECKSLSADAGRKIHRKDFYRFIDAIGPKIAQRAENGANEVLVVTLEDRLPSDTAQQNALRAAAIRMLADPNIGQFDGNFFTIVRDNYAGRLRAAAAKSQSEFYKACSDDYGEDCHASGAMTPDGGCLIVMRSHRADDHSRPLLEAIKKAATQLSGKRPGFIAVQFDDITPADLVLAHLRRRAGILSYYLFHEYKAAHVAAAYFCVYGGLTASPGGLGTPAFAVPNPEFNFKQNENLPFLTSLPDEDFARLVDAPPPAESISFIPIDSTK